MAEKNYKVKILEIGEVTHDVKRFMVEKPENYAFIPGQATEVSVNQKGFEDKKRPFTFTSFTDDNFLEFVIKTYPLNKYPDHGGVTEKIHTLKEGDELIIGEAWGAINYKGPGVFVAGGAGITPFIAILRELHKKDEVKGNKLIFSNKEKKDIILEKELKEIFGSDMPLFTLTREKVEGYLDKRVDGNFLRENISDISVPFYICGPKEMIKSIKDFLEEEGVESQNLIFEK